MCPLIVESLFEMEVDLFFDDLFDNWEAAEPALCDRDFCYILVNLHVIDVVFVANGIVRDSYPTVHKMNLCKKFPICSIHR